MLRTLAATYALMRASCSSSFDITRATGTIADGGEGGALKAERRATGLCGCGCGAKRLRVFFFCVALRSNRFKTPRSGYFATSDLTHRLQVGNPRDTRQVSILLIVSYVPAAPEVPPLPAGVISASSTTAVADWLLQLNCTLSQTVRPISPVRVVESPFSIVDGVANACSTRGPAEAE